MKEKHKPTKETAGGSGGADIFNSDQNDGLVTVTSGPYAEQLPLAKMKVSEIRSKFGDRFDIDPAAQAVVDGKDVEDDTIVMAHQVLMFVRRAGEKGNEIHIKGATATALSPEGAKGSIPLGVLLGKLSSCGISTGNIVLPTGVKMVMSKGTFTIWVYEMPPHVENLKWIAADSPAMYGPGAKYRQVRLALPYTVIMALFHGDGNGRNPGTCLSQMNECFFRNEPLKSPEDELFYPALLNCSRFPNTTQPLSWICTQHLSFPKIWDQKDANARMRMGLTKLKHCLFETGFNLSSDVHELASWFTETTKAEVDKRLATVEKWQEASKENPLFVLDVPWLKTGKSVKQVAERMFKNSGAKDAAEDINSLARVIFNHKEK
jgi:hypothetical protein